MSKYDDLFDDTAPDESLFVDKRALDPLADPAEIHARDSQERELATLLNGVHDGYLPPTVSLDGPPGTGKTLTTRRVCREFAARHEQVAIETAEHSAVSGRRERRRQRERATTIVVPVITRAVTSGV